MKKILYTCQTSGWQLYRFNFQYQS